MTLRCRWINDWSSGLFWRDLYGPTIPFPPFSSSSPLLAPSPLVLGVDPTFFPSWPIPFWYWNVILFFLVLSNPFYCIFIDFHDSWIITTFSFIFGSIDSHILLLQSSTCSIGIVIHPTDWWSLTLATSWLSPLLMLRNATVVLLWENTRVVVVSVWPGVYITGYLEVSVA